MKLCSMLGLNTGNTTSLRIKVVCLIVEAAHLVFLVI
jgi:hypothetical protein